MAAAAISLQQEYIQNKASDYLLKEFEAASRAAADRWLNFYMYTMFLKKSDGAASTRHF
jgi:hypothetical protein